jgi:NhaP-type Na+/H+ or K+/H+ antiporter
VINSPRVPARIRRALNVEAGLNDGLSLPFLMLFIALARVDGPLQQPSWIAYTLGQIGFGLAAGLALGWGGGWLLHQATRRGWMTETFQQLGLLALALMTWGAAEALGGNGFIAAFVGGLAVKLGFEKAGDTMIEFSEAWGQLLDYGVFFLFGLLAAVDLERIGGLVWLYALLSLTLIRMLPVAVALIGTRLRPATVLFLGWFGPRGLASIVLGLIFLKEEASLPGEPLIDLVVTATVLLSVFAHGISAAPGINLYARQVEQMEPDAPERRTVTEMPAGPQ